MQYKIRNINNIKNQIKTQRFLKPLIENKIYLLVEISNLKLKIENQLRKNIQTAQATLRMTLKRLVHKLFFGERKKNAKTIFKQNLYQIICDENTDYNAISTSLQQIKAQIVAIVYQQVMIQDYHIYIMSQLKKEKLIALVIKMLLLPHLLLFDSIVNKLVCNKKENSTNGK